MSEVPPCPPGSHPHADQPNWRPADTAEDYLTNCREGLEEYSERRVAKLFGISRIELWRWKMMARLPDDLFDALLKGRRTSTKALAAIAVALQNGGPVGDAERCRRCGGVLRVRPSVSRENIKIVVQWLNKRQAEERRPLTARERLPNRRHNGGPATAIGAALDKLAEAP
jgi:hypothetical protein